MPKTATSGHRTSPTTTPSASGQAPWNPAESVRAMIATQTGPGVRNRISSAPA